MTKDISIHRHGNMRLVIDELARQQRSLAWLAAQLDVSRQSVSVWNNVPWNKHEAVEAIIGIKFPRGPKVKLGRPPMKQARESAVEAAE